MRQKTNFRRNKLRMIILVKPTSGQRKPLYQTSQEQRSPDLPLGTSVWSSSQFPVKQAEKLLRSMKCYRVSERRRNISASPSVSVQTVTLTVCCAVDYEKVHCTRCCDVTEQTGNLLETEHSAAEAAAVITSPDLKWLISLKHDRKLCCYVWRIYRFVAIQQVAWSWMMKCF